MDSDVISASGSQPSLAAVVSKENAKPAGLFGEAKPSERGQAEKSTNQHILHRSIQERSEDVAQKQDEAPVVKLAGKEKISTQADIPELPDMKDRNISETTAQPVRTEKPSDREPKAKPETVAELLEVGSQEASTAKADSSATPVRRQHPGRLDIAAATTITPQQQQALTKAPGTNSAPVSASSRPSTPAISADSPAKRTVQPRSLRVVCSTPKAETLPSVPSSAASGAASALLAGKEPALKPSSASIQVSTPTTEVISDNASLATTSFSRANSPPPGGKVGSAPGRAKTKSQLKKERQERAKLIEEVRKVEDSTQTAEDEIIQAPIAARKKKSKKNETTPKASSTPIPSRPASPPADGKVQGQEAQETLTQESSGKRDLVEEPKVQKADSAQKQGPKTSRQNSTAVKIVSELLGTLASASDGLFRPIVGLNTRHEITNTELASLGPMPQLTEEEKQKLSKGEPVHRGGDDGRSASRIIITPTGSCLRGLSEPQEKRFLELEQELVNTKATFKFNSHSSYADDAAKALRERVRIVKEATRLRNTPASAQKIYADETFSYINQHVIPMLARTIPGISGVGISQGDDRLPKSKFDEAIDNSYTGVPIGLETQATFAVEVPAVGAEMVTTDIRFGAGWVSGANVDAIESELAKSRKETEALEKKLNALIKKNKRMTLGAV